MFGIFPLVIRGTVTQLQNLDRMRYRSADFFVIVVVMTSVAMLKFLDYIMKVLWNH